jgi:hypothetical protein
MNSNPPQSNEVPTPISDALAVRWTDVKSDTWYVPRIHVRNLERELAEANANLEHCEVDLRNARKQLSLLTKPIEPVRLRIAVETLTRKCVEARREASMIYAVYPSQLETLLLAVRQREWMGDKVLNLHALIGLLIGALEGCKMQVDAGLKQRIDNVLEKALNQLKTGGDGK